MQTLAGGGDLISDEAAGKPDGVSLNVNHKDDRGRSESGHHPALDRLAHHNARSGSSHTTSGHPIGGNQMLGHMNPALLAALLVAFFSSTPSTAAELTRCDTPMFLVASDDRDLHRRACKVVMRALPELEACHLRPDRPISLRFHAALSSPDRVCLGLYHSGTDQIDLLTPDAFHAQHLRSEFCQGVPENEHFDSIIVHELVHALLDQVPGGTTDYVIDQEYIAYALQFKMMQKPVRDGFLSSIGIAPPIEAQWINDMLLLFSPSAFAATAWLHFSDQKNGCDFVGKIIQEEQTFFREPY